MAAGADAAVKVTTTEPVRAEASATADAEAAEAKEDVAPEERPKKSRKTSASTKRSAPGAIKLHKSTTGEGLSCESLCKSLLAIRPAAFLQVIALAAALWWRLILLSAYRKCTTGQLGERQTLPHPKDCWCIATKERVSGLCHACRSSQKEGAENNIQ